MPLPARKIDKRGKGQGPAYKAAPAREKAIAAKLGGEVVRGSGAGREKGDVRLKRKARVEAKCTAAKSFSVTREMIAKIENAAGPGELPLLAVEFVDQQGKLLQRCYVLPDYALEQLLAEYPGTP